MYDLYSLEDVSHFLDATFKKSIKVGDYFSDTDKFIKSVDMLKRQVGFDLLEEKKHFCLRKHITRGKQRLVELLNGSKK